MFLDSTTLDEINTKNDTDNNLAIFQKQIDNIQVKIHLHNKLIFFL